MTYWMRRLRVALPWLAVALLANAVVMLTLLPAAWITPQFGRQTHGHVNLVNPTGSLWHGSATLMLAAGSDMSAATLLPGRIEWRTAFWPLFTGRVRMTMRHSEAMPDPITVDATLRSATITPGALAVPASLLSGLGAPFNTLDLQGDVRLAWSDWRSFNQEAFGQLTVTLNDVSSRVSLVKPLGSYRLLFQAQGVSSTLDLTTLKGPLMLTGNGTVSAVSTSFRGTASAAPEARDNLAGLLNLLGRPSGPDTVALTFVH
ncbi:MULTISPECIES: type II secretion system protein N [Paraburkholderia]|jgi:general secretion pathway protein N|uniref:type II secretion system protein N n=1 Tax=Paraburkholderia TaxID=1822464 RepID=UPI001B086714|nr:MULTISPECIES: type II secretion system protein N [Paraburkholderia]MCP2086186.1 general secretion pathway protein N [Paraburkholderia sediminicola]MCX4140437.1 type II secretion system protein N [Paraburkholderia aspalathi]MCX4156355.1 type II secretion system protein N [Paraburkholderia aspalathi]MDN7165760.1 type II secretion system protein N [Paraburkholderia sp. SECH2]MDN7173122.1 type II secretion system protein N [Paraburkholderia sp. SEWSISQ10-3 4]